MSYELSDYLKNIYFKVEQFFAHKTKKELTYKSENFRCALLY